MQSKPGVMSLFFGDVPVGSGMVPRTTPIIHGLAAFAVGYQLGGGGGIDPALLGRADIPPAVLERVINDAAAGALRNHAAEDDVQIAMQ